ncbi:MAG: hypothetical protein AAF810_02265 [Cyanobacteria bacterium P01_D01_bin.36]
MPLLLIGANELRISMMSLAKPSPPKVESLANVPNEAIGISNYIGLAEKVRIGAINSRPLISVLLGQSRYRQLGKR